MGDLLEDYPENFGKFSYLIDHVYIVETKSQNTHNTFPDIYNLWKDNPLFF